MRLKVETTDILGVLIFSPKVYDDDRGFFMETYNKELYQQAGLSDNFVQDNYSHSTKGTLRGLHYQLPHTQGKLVSVIWGEVFDVAVDIRKNSPTFGKWVGLNLSDQNRKQLYIPEGLAHGFCVLSEKADVIYKCTDTYSPDSDRGILWSDPAIGIEWPTLSSIISDKDKELPLLSEIPGNLLPEYHG
ncbi:MAG: dTDP-4-dehydrorhamnose 3,5-epimerase [Kiritimatiellae bacterium]|nr:dTDP-4-dehydrorhamnose 3,5-epimerase [Kiritimatiellia bacterium]